MQKCTMSFSLCQCIEINPIKQNLQYSYCLSHFGLLEQNAIDWMTYKQQKCISHNSGGWESEIKVSVCLGSDESCLPVCRLPTSLCALIWQKERKQMLL